MPAGEAVGFADIAKRRETLTLKLPGPPLSLLMSPGRKFAYIGV
jgi:hypothetical protein